MTQQIRRHGPDLARVAALALSGVVLAAVGTLAQSSPSPEASSAPAASSASAASSAPARSPAATTNNLSAAADYCTSVGGQVQERRATWNTNQDPSAWVDLGRTIELCRFQADDEAQSRIYVDLLTLWQEEPSLAAGAYLAGLPTEADASQGNPATVYCAQQLYGSAQSGSGAQGGGWVAPDDPDDPVVAMCVFPDGSMIDEWGIAYKSGGAVRGADLSKLFRSAARPYPQFFG